MGVISYPTYVWIIILGLTQMKCGIIIQIKEGGKRDE
jgi:hypothetical protein